MRRKTMATPIDDWPMPTTMLEAASEGYRLRQEIVRRVRALEREHDRYVAMIAELDRIFAGQRILIAGDDDDDGH